MSIPPISSDMHTRLENFKPEDIKNLVQQKGKATEGDKVFALIEPSLTDPNLQAIIHDPNFEIRSIGDQHKSGEMYYDLKGTDRQLRVKVTCHKLK